MEVISDPGEHFVLQLFNLDLNGAWTHIDILVGSIFEFNDVIIRSTFFNIDA